MSDQFPPRRIERTDALIPYARNARTHSTEQIAKIAASIREFGFTNPVLVDGANGIIAGHGRVLAAHKLGMPEVPVIELAHLSEAQKRAYILADNRLALDAGWDNDLLKIELGDLNELGFDLSLTGFADLELAELLDSNAGLTDPDDAPEVQPEAVSRLGDVWLLGVYYECQCGAQTDLQGMRHGFRSGSLQPEMLQPGMPSDSAPTSQGGLQANSQGSRNRAPVATKSEKGSDRPSISSDGERQAHKGGSDYAFDEAALLSDEKAAWRDGGLQALAGREDSGDGSLPGLRDNRGPHDRSHSCDVSGGLASGGEPADSLPQLQRSKRAEHHPLCSRCLRQLGIEERKSKHRLCCGDCTDADVVALALNGVKPHLMVTDPPYGVSYDAGWRNKAKRADGTPIGAYAVGVVSNDDRADWAEAWALFPGDVAYIWHGAVHVATVADSLVVSGFDIRSQIVWVKSNFAISRGHYHPQHEPCFYAVRKAATGHWSGDRKQSTVWQIDKPAKSETGHSTQKPVECMRRPIENNSRVGDAVYEPFSGSGTTIIAAEMTGRACHAIEIEPGYVDVAIRRWQSFTGQSATLESTHQTFTDLEKERLQVAA